MSHAGFLREHTEGDADAGVVALIRALAAAGEEAVLRPLREGVSHVHEAIEGRMTKKDTASAVQVLFDTLAGAIKDDGRFSYPGFGTFNVKERNERQGRNPRTGETMTFAAKTSVKFKAAKAASDAVN